MMAHKVIRPRKKRLSVNLDTASCLHVYVYEDNQREVTQILKSNFSEYILDARDDLGRTPLYLTACYRRNDLAKQLLQAGRDAKIPQDNGNTVLHEAVEKNCQEIVNEVLKHDSTVVDVKNKAGETAVFKAAYFDYDQILKALIKYGASPEISNNAGVTPLFCALTEGSEKTARYLIQTGCDVNKADSEGHTVLYILLHSKYIKRFEQILEDLLQTEYDFRGDARWLLGCKRHFFHKKEKLYQTLMEAAGLPVVLPFSNNICTKFCSNEQQL